MRFSRLNLGYNSILKLFQEGCTKSYVWLYILSAAQNLLPIRGKREEEDRMSQHGHCWSWPSLIKSLTFEIAMKTLKTLKSTFRKKIFKSQKKIVFATFRKEDIAFHWKKNFFTTCKR